MGRYGRKDMVLGAWNRAIDLIRAWVVAVAELLLVLGSAELRWSGERPTFVGDRSGISHG
ncbi:MAG: hypothetical protein ACP5O0_03955 [Acidimicrobiales bacterium]